MLSHDHAPIRRNRLKTNIAHPASVIAFWTATGLIPKQTNSALSFSFGKNKPNVSSRLRISQSVTDHSGISEKNGHRGNSNSPPVVSHSKMLITPSSPDQVIAQVACARTTGLAWKATEVPASAIIFRSLAPSPMATVWSFLALNSLLTV